MNRSLSSVFLLCACLSLGLGSGCSLLLDFTECETNEECGGGACLDGVCEQPACVDHDDCAEAGDEFSCIGQRCIALDESMCTLDSDLEPSSGPILHLGTLLPYTGRNAAKAEATAAAAKTALKQINLTHNGVRGVQLSVLECDTEQNSEHAVEVATYLVETVGLSSVIGSISSGETLAISDITIPNDVVMVSPASTSPVITTLEDDDLVWRTIPSDALQGPALAQIVADGGHEKILIFSVESAYGQGLFNAFIGSGIIPNDSIEPLNYTVDDKGDLIADSVVDDVTALLSAGSYVPDAILVLGSLESQQLIFALDDTFFGELTEEEKPVWILSEAGRDGGLLDDKFSSVWTRIRGTIIQTPASAVYDDFRLRYETNYGFKATENPFADKAYDAAFVLALAHGAYSDPTTATGPEVAANLQKIAQGDTFRPGDDLTGALNKLAEDGVDYTGASGPVDFDPDTGDVLSDISEWQIIVSSDGDPDFETVGVAFSAGD